MRLADAVPPVPPSADVTAPVVLFLVPAVVPVTFTVIVQDPPAARPPLASATLPDPAVAVTVPPHVFASPFGVATTSPVGSVSVKPTPVSAVGAFGLVSVNVNAVVAFRAMLAPPKALAIVGGTTTAAGHREAGRSGAARATFGGRDGTRGVVLGSGGRPGHVHA